MVGRKVGGAREIAGVYLRLIVVCVRKGHLPNACLLKKAFYFLFSLNHYYLNQKDHF